MIRFLSLPFWFVHLPGGQLYGDGTLSRYVGDDYYRYPLREKYR